MGYLADVRARTRRADPHLILPEAESLLILAEPYPNPKLDSVKPTSGAGEIAAYARIDDYHLTLKEKLQNIVKFIEKVAP